MSCIDPPRSEVKFYITNVQAVLLVRCEDLDIIAGM